MIPIVTTHFALFQVEEVREKRQKVIERKRQLLESRMERAQENREKNITEIIRRAKDDEQKVLVVLSRKGVKRSERSISCHMYPSLIQNSGSMQPNLVLHHP